MFDGQKIVAGDGVCMGQDGTLYGSDLDMASALRNAVRLMEQDLAVAANMASRNPAAFLTDDLHVARSWFAGRA